MKIFSKYLTSVPGSYNFEGVITNGEIVRDSGVLFDKLLKCWDIKRF